MLPLLAQLVAPPLQPGPIRLPGADQQRSLPVVLNGAFKSSCLNQWNLINDQF